MNARLDFSDFAFKALNSKERTLDFAMVGELSTFVSPEKLEEGARQAFAIYPKSNCFIQGLKWRTCPHEYKIEIVRRDDDNWKESAKSYLARPFELHDSRAIKQALIVTPSKQALVTRMHHALGDGLSLFAWLMAQFEQDSTLVGELKIKAAPKRPSKKSKYANSKPSRALSSKEPGMFNKRGWESRSFEKLISRAKGHSYNDLLSAVIMESLQEFTMTRGISDSGIGLYIPMDIRYRAFKGFGNGSSRVKLYRGESSGHAEQARHIREQIKWCADAGLWSAPKGIGPISVLGEKALGGLLRFYSSRPHHDYCSSIFSHVERMNGLEKVFDYFSSYEFVCQLHKAYSFALAAVTRDGRTHLSATYDEDQHDKNDMDLFFEIFEKNRLTAYEEAKA